MGLRWIEGFDAYGDNEDFLDDGAWSSISFVELSSDARSGNRALRLYVPSSVARRTFGSELTDGGIGFALKLTSLPSITKANNLKFYDSDGHVVFYLTISNAGELVVYAGDFAGTELGRSGQVVYTGAYQHIELHFDSTSCEIRLNEVTVLNISADMFNHYSGGTIHNPPASCGWLGDIGMSEMKIDDIFVWDSDTGGAPNTFVGDKKVLTIFPTSDTAVADWTPSAGASQYGILDNNPPDDSVYLSTSTAGDKTIVNLSGMPDEVISIVAVMTQVRTWKSDAGGGTITVSMLSESVIEDGENRAVSLRPTYYSDVFNVDPDTGAPWTVAGINAAQLQLERIT